MSKKLTGRALAQFEARRGVWQEVLDGVRAIKTGGARRVVVDRWAITRIAPTLRANLLWSDLG